MKFILNKFLLIIRPYPFKRKNGFTGIIKFTYKMFSKTTIATLALIGSASASYGDWLKLKNLSYTFHTTVEMSHKCFVEDNSFADSEWCVFFRAGGMDALRDVLTELAESDECLSGQVCESAFGIEPATDHEDEWLNYLETRKLSYAFHYAVEQSQRCYIED